MNHLILVSVALALLASLWLELDSAHYQRSHSRNATDVKLFSVEKLWILESSLNILRDSGCVRATRFFGQRHFQLMKSSN